MPFVAIRVVSGDRQSGALRIEHQHPLSSFARIAIKAAVLLAGWLVVSAGADDRRDPVGDRYGGACTLPELADRDGRSSAECRPDDRAGRRGRGRSPSIPSTAAIVTLTVTVGTWLMNFAAAVNGGWWERAAAYTPTAMVAEFQRGLLRADVILVAVVLIGVGLGLAAIWLRLGDRDRAAGCGCRSRSLAIARDRRGRRVARDGELGRVREPAQLVLAGGRSRVARRISGDLRIEAHFAPEDPRRSDLELRSPAQAAARAAATATSTTCRPPSVGLFEQTADHYGEIWYEFDGRTAMSRVDDG